MGGKVKKPILENKGFSRRSFLASSVAGVSSVWLASNWPEIAAAQAHAHRAAISPQPENFEFFSPGQAAEFEAVAAQIIPTNDTPGAHEARTIYFIDRALTTFARDSQPLYREGLRQLQQKSGELFANTTKFSALTSPQQIQVLTAIEKTPFFAEIRLHTILGFFSDPGYGGNHEKTGWKLIGFDDSFVFSPPFGDYDRDFKS
jgi:gluconate 2-dehydrogenase gamma chain